jgi:hypothetical protein
MEAGGRTVDRLLLICPSVQDDSTITGTLLPQWVMSLPVLRWLALVAVPMFITFVERLIRQGGMAWPTSNGFNLKQSS